MPPKKAAKKGEKAEEEPKKTEPEKRKVEEAKEEEPAKKEAKKEEPEEKVEEEKDAPSDTRPKVKDALGFNVVDTSLNVIPTMDGKLLTSLTEGGLQYLIAGARANVGVKAGRYLFEAKILEVLNPPDGGTVRGARPPMPRQLMRIGFSTAGSPLVLGEHAEHICFDSEGGFFAESKKRSLGKQRFTHDQAVGVLLNLDPKSPNKNTVSLFRDGERISDPMPLPEAMHGKVLYPHLAFRNVSIHVPFGAAPMRELPFKCRTVAEAAKADVAVAVAKKQSQYDVVFPVGFPDEGTFDWLGEFLKKNPEYVELSDRAVMDWAKASGLTSNKSAVTPWKNSNDKPEFAFGLPGMDDRSIFRVVNSIAPIVPRNYVVMEVKSNLVEAERKENLQRFRAPHFKKVARVAMGEPNTEYKQGQHDQLLQEKQEEAEKQWKVQKLAAERKKQLEAQRKLQQDTVKKMMEEKKAAEKKAADEKKAKEGGEEGKETKEEEVKEEEKKEGAKEEAKEEEVKDEKKEDEVPEEPPTAELTDEEKKMWFRPKITKDLSEAVLGTCFGSFSLPTKAEGFDEVQFEWSKEIASKKYLKNWILEKKKTSRVEDLKPGAWFTEKQEAWRKLLAEYQGKQEKSKPTEKKSEEEDDAEKQAALSVDVSAVTDVCDVGTGKPLFQMFAFEDWALLQLRFELFLLLVAFKKDIDDPDRTGIPEAHLNFYYSKYFKKQLTAKHFGKDANAELMALIADTAAWSEEDKMLTTPVEEESDFGEFVKFTEEKRRERQRRLDAGDETARLKVSSLAMPSPAQSKLAAAGMRPAGLVAGAAAQQPAAAGQQQQQQQKWSGGATRSTPYGQGSGKGGAGGGAWGGGGGWGRKW